MATITTTPSTTGAALAAPPSQAVALPQTFVNAMTQFGLVADKWAASNVITDYLDKQTENTRKGKRADIATFLEYLSDAGLPAALRVDDYYRHAEPWTLITYGMVEGFRAWMLSEGYAISTIGRKLATVRKYCELARLATVDAAGGAPQMTAEQLALIQTVKSYSRKDGRNIDKERARTRIDRPEAKKASNVVLTVGQVQMLKTHEETPQGRRDALLMCLLLDHGLRSSEVALVETKNVRLVEREFDFYRPKVDLTDTHRLTDDTLAAMRAWLESGDAPADGRLLRGSRKGGALTTAGMSERAITARVKALGEAIGIQKLSAHDCRHYWATRAIKSNTDPFSLMQAGGWTSIATVQKYIDKAERSNEHVKGFEASVPTK